MRPIRPCTVCGTTRKSVRSARCHKHVDGRAKASAVSAAMRAVWAQRRATGYVPSTRGVEAMRRWHEERRGVVAETPTAAREMSAAEIEAAIERRQAGRRPTWGLSRCSSEVGVDG